MRMARGATSPQGRQPIRIFSCSCDHLESKQYCNELEPHLAPLQREGLVVIQQSHRMLVGLVWNKEIRACVYTADIIVLWISSSLFGSDEYWDIMEHAMRLHDEGRLHLVPILASPVDYESTHIGDLQVLPRRKKPLSKMSRRSEREEAYVEIAKNIREVVQNLQSCTSGEEDVAKVENDGEPGFNDPAFWKAKGDKFSQLQQYDKAMAAYDKAISLNNNYADVYKARGELHGMLASLNNEMYEELKRLFDQSDDVQGEIDEG